MRSARRGSSALQIWRWPLALAATSSAGLVAALVADGVWDFFSWVTLGAPVAITGVAWWRAIRKVPATQANG